VKISLKMGLDFMHYAVDVTLLQINQFCFCHFHAALCADLGLSEIHLMNEFASAVAQYTSQCLSRCC